MSIMHPIVSISKMENFLLTASSVDDILTSSPAQQDPTKKLTAKEVKQDVSIICASVITYL